MYKNHQSFPECYPEDGWNTVTYLDNSQSSTPTTFTFSQSIGPYEVPPNQLSKINRNNSYRVSTLLSTYAKASYVFFVKIVLLLGVTLGHDETNSGSISTTIKNAITVGLGEIFSYTLDISTTTGKCSNHKFHYKQNQIKKKDIDATYESCDIWASQYKHCQRHNGPEG